MCREYSGEGVGKASPSFTEWCGREGGREGGWVGGRRDGEREGARIGWMEGR